MCRSLFLAIFLFAGSIHAGEHWPGWRGPTGMGTSDEKDLPLEWDGKTGKNVLWKSPLLPSDKVKPDQNQSSPIVWGDRVFVTVSYWPKEGPTAPPKKPDPSAPAAPYPEHHVLCFHATDGKPLWDRKIEPGPWQLSDLRGGYTAPTPACDGERVYVLFGSAVLAALDMDGKPLWRKEIKPHSFDVAVGVSPVIHRDTVIVVCDQLNKASSIQAFDTKSGDLRWEQKRPEADWAHSTPTLAQVKGETQLIVATANGPQGLDPSNGKVIWSFHHPQRVGDTVSPVVRDGQTYVDSGRGGPGIAVDVTGKGDVTKTHLRWTIKTVPSGFSSPALVDDQLYRLHTPGTLSVFNWTTGKEVFKERLPGSEPASSPFTTPEGRIYFANAGKSYVIQAGPKLEVLAVNELDDASRASPAVAGGRIYLKGARWLFCVGRR